MRTRLKLFLLPLLVALAAPVVALAQTIEPVRPDDRTLGSASAPVTLTVYLSPTCPHCASWHSADFPAIRAKYVDSGQVRVVFRELPTPPIEPALAGIVLARCAPEDRYQAVLEGLYESHALLTQGEVVPWLKAGATKGGLSDERANECLADEAGWNNAIARANASVAEGVNSTPAFFLNGAPAPRGGSRDLAGFDALLQPLLAP